jgi:hypothetical protein
VSEVRKYSCRHNRHVKSKLYNCGWDCEFVDKGFWEHIPPASDYVLWEDYKSVWADREFLQKAYDDFRSDTFRSDAWREEQHQRREALAAEAKEIQQLKNKINELEKQVRSYNRLKAENKKFRVMLSIPNPPQESEEPEAPKQDA